MSNHRFPQKDHFFDRTVEAEEVARLWHQCQLTVLHGRSGAGKSSLLRSRVIPALQATGARVLPLGHVGRRPIFPRAALPEQNRFSFPLLTSWYPEDSPTRLAGVSVQGVLRKRLGSDRFGSPQRTLACIDQAELFFRRSELHEHQRLRFLADLDNTLAAHSNLHLLVIVRDTELYEALSFAEVVGARDISVAIFRLGPLRLNRIPDHGHFPGLLNELDTVRTDTGHRIHTGKLDPALFQVVHRRLPAEADRIPEESLVETVNRLLSGYGSQVLATVADDRRLPRTDVEAWFHSVFLDPQCGRRAVTDEDGMPSTVLRALEDHHLIAGCREDDGVPVYELQHPRLIEAMHTPPPRFIPPHRPGPQARLQQAVLACGDADFVLARSHAEAAVRGSRPDDLQFQAEAECLLGDIAYEESKAEQAIEHYEKAALKFEALPNTASVVGQLLTAIGRLTMEADPVLAMEKLRAAASRLSHDHCTLTALGQALWQTGQTQAALAVVNGILTTDGDSAEALRIRGEILADLGEAEPAIRDLFRVDHATDPSTRAAWALAKALRQEAETEPESLEDSAAGDNGQVLLRLARVRQLTGNTRTAAELATKAMSAQRPPLPPQLVGEARSIQSNPVP